MIRTNRIQALLTQHPDLHRLGYGKPPGKQQISDAARSELLTPPARVRIHAALTWIETNLVPAGKDRARAHSTYHWKHCMQRQTGVYVSNGEFAAAALLSRLSVDTHYYNPLLLAAHVPRGSQP